MFLKRNEEEKVYKLKNSFYELKQLQRDWYHNIDRYVIQKELVESKNELTLYVKKKSSCDILIVGMYIEDSISTGYN